jgi:hypothetical protein
MWGHESAAMALARQAAAEASEAKTMSTVLLAKLTDHVDGCGKNWEKLERRMAEVKTDNGDWQAGLGKRLDRQDRINLTALCTVLGTAVAIIGFLVAPFFHVAVH